MIGRKKIQKPGQSIIFLVLLFLIFLKPLFSSPSLNASKGEERSAIFFILTFTATSFVIRPLLIFFRSNKAKMKDISFTKNPIILDFSQKEKADDYTIATFEVTNPGESKRKTFELQFEGSYRVTSSSKNMVLSYLTIEKCPPEEKSEVCKIWPDADSIPNLHIKNVQFGDRFQIVINPKAIQFTDVKEQTIDYELTLDKFKIDTGEKVRELKYEPSPPEKQFKLKIIPDKARWTIEIEENEKGFIIPYSARSRLQKVFKFTVNNTNQQRISSPVEGTLSLEVDKIGDGNLKSRRSNNIFFFHESETPDDKRNYGQEWEICLGHRGSNFIFCGVNFEALGKSPEKPMDFQIRLVFKPKHDDKIYEECPKRCNIDVTITPAEERTTPVIQILGEDKSPCLNNRINCRIIPKDFEGKIEDFTIPQIDIYEDDITELFSLWLGNLCNTDIGHYEWEIKDIKLTNNSGNEILANNVVTVEKSKGEISDKIEDTAKVAFLLNPGNFKVEEYQFSFGVKFILILSIPFVDKKPKEISLTVNITGRPKIADDYLVIDFGTTAVSAAHSYYTADGKNKQKTKILEFASIDDKLMKIKDGLLPSIININEGKTIGHQDFVCLPAVATLNNFTTDRLFAGIKLSILDGSVEIQSPDNFEFVDEKGSDHKGGDPMNLGSLFQSVYKNLKKNYLADYVNDCRKLIITHPNAYNDNHKKFLKKIVSEAFGVEGDENKSKDKHNLIYADENIELISESDAVLVRYLSLHSQAECKDRPEEVIICDVGGGTLDLTYAKVEWEQEKDYPKNIKIVKRDGMDFAGDTLDMAIALQVHEILEQYEKVTPSSIEYSPQTQEVKEKEVEIPVSVSQYLKRGKGGISLSKQEKNISSSYPPVTRDFYKYKIAREKNESKSIEIDLLKQTMFNLKFIHILDFKELMSQTKDKEDEERVDICLGENGGVNPGLCFLAGSEPPSTDIKIGDRSFSSEIKKGKKGLYLSLKKQDWLQLPYLQQFKKLFKKNLQQFVKSGDNDISKKAHIILSGRASLWPQIKEVILEIFKKNDPTYIKYIDQGPNTKDMALALKKAVVEGALWKFEAWKRFVIKDTPYGQPAINYSKGKDRNGQQIWEAKALYPAGGYEEIDLTNSSIFELGIKTSMAFYPFLGGNYFITERLCGNNKIKISVRETKENLVGYDFSVKSDKYQRTPKTLRFDRYNKKKARKRWPIEPVQLPHVDLEAFNEKIDKEVDEYE